LRQRTLSNLEVKKKRISLKI